MKNVALALALLFTATPAFAQFGQLSKLKQQADRVKKLSDMNISDKDERVLGEQVSTLIRTDFGVYQDDAVAKYVTLVGNVLAQASSRPNLDWQFIRPDRPSQGGAQRQEHIAQGEGQYGGDQQGLPGNPSGQEPGKRQGREDDDGRVHSCEGTHGGLVNAQVAADLGEQTRGQEFGGHRREAGCREHQKATPRDLLGLLPFHGRRFGRLRLDDHRVLLQKLLLGDGPCWGAVHRGLGQPYAAKAN